MSKHIPSYPVYIHKSAAKDLGLLPLLRAIDQENAGRIIYVANKLTAFAQSDRETILEFIINHNYRADPS